MPRRQPILLFFLLGGFLTSGEFLWSEDPFGSTDDYWKFWEQVESKIYRHPAFLESVWYRMEMIVGNMEGEGDLPADFIATAIYDVEVDFRWQDKLFEEKLLSLRANGPHYRVPAGAPRGLHEIIKWGNNPIYLIPNLGQYARDVRDFERVGDLWKFALRDSPATSTPPGSWDRILWVDRPSLTLAGYQYEDTIGVHHYLFTWEPAFGGRQLRLKTLTVSLHQPGKSGERVQYQTIWYTHAEGIDLPSEIAFRTTLWDGTAGRNADFRFLEYKVQKRKFLK